MKLFTNGNRQFYPAICCALICFLTSFSVGAVKVDNKTTFVVGNYIFQIGDMVGDSEAWLVGVKPDITLEGEITIPGSATINGIKYTVTRIGPEPEDLTDSMWWYEYEPALLDQPSITKLNIPSTIQEIEPWEFLGCNGITEFHVNASNKNFKDESGILFRYNKFGTWELFRMPPATKKTKYTLPAEVSYICDNAFADNKTIKTIIVAHNTNFSYFWSHRNGGIYEINVDGNEYLESLDGVIYSTEHWTVDNEAVGKYGYIIACPPALAKDKLILPSSVKYLASGAFANTNIKEVIIPSSIKYIGSYVFYNSKLKSLDLPVGNIDSESDCMYGLCLDSKELESVYLSSSSGKHVKLNYHMFRGCEKLNSFVADSNNLDLYGYAFYGCSSLTSFPFAKLSSVPLPSTRCRNHFAYSGLTSARIPSFMASVPEGMFMGSALESVNLNPSGKDNLIRIYANAFKDCKLTEINTAQIREFRTNCFAGNPLKKVVLPDNPYADEDTQNSITINRAFTPDENTWFYVGDNMINWECTYNWYNGHDDVGLYRANYVSSDRLCRNVPNNFNKVYGPAGCESIDIGWSKPGVGEIHSMFSMSSDSENSDLILEPRTDLSDISVTINSVELMGFEAENQGNVWSYRGIPNVWEVWRNIYYTVNGHNMMTYYPEGFSTGIEMVDSVDTLGSIIGIHSIDGVKVAEDYDSLEKGIYIITYADGKSKKIFKK